MDPSEDEKISGVTGSECLCSSGRRYNSNPEDLSPILKNDQSRSPVHKESISESMEELDYEDEKEESDVKSIMDIKKHISIHQDICNNSEENVCSNNCEMSMDIGKVSDYDDRHSDSEKNLCSRDGHFSKGVQPMFNHQSIHSDLEKILRSSDGELSLSVGHASDCLDIHSDSNKNLGSFEARLSMDIELTSDNQDRHLVSEKNLCSCETKLSTDTDPMSTYKDKNFDSEKNLYNFDSQSGTKDVQIGMGRKEYDEGEIEEGEAVDDDGSADVEEGEIEEVSINDNLNKYSCRFYQRGKCIWGKGCRFLHLSDKGLYNMFDSFVEEKKVPAHSSCFTNETNFNCQPFFEPEERSESIWDRALNEAKERIKQSRVRKDECFDKDKLYMTVENSDKFIEKSKNVEHFHARAISPAPISKKPNCDFSSRMDFYKSDRQIYIKDAVKPKVAKKTYGIKSSYHSEWRDPWRRSKTPPKRKRITSKSSVSSKSSISHDDSVSSSETTSRCRSPIVKRPLRRSNSRSRSYRRQPHRQSPLRSSCSCSSPSSRSSAEFSSRRLRSGKRKRNSFSVSPVYRRKDSHSPEIVLPFTRRSPSESPLRTSRKVHLRNKSVERKHSKGSFSSISRSRSRSFSSKSSAKKEQSGEKRSCSDMSISPLSDSSLSKKSESSDSDFDNRLRDPVPQKGQVRATPKDSRLARRHIDITSVSSKGKPDPDKQPCASSTKVPTKLENSKKMCVLEMELLKYQGGFKPVPKHPPVETKFSQSASKLSDAKRGALLAESSIAKLELVDPNKPSKRDLLIKQLQAVEEAIARKRKSHYLT